MAKKKTKCKWFLKKPYYVTKGDKRYKKYVAQLTTTGISDDETWNLFCVIAEFALPRLKRFKEIPIGYPGNITSEKWDEILGEMIFAFEYALMDDDEQAQLKMRKGYYRHKRGMKLFAQYFLHLWT